ncbi:hypothetical protein HY227_02195 [Candidatus Wolfebacteria bacterium]|nr:hypothetical protein [Candidatus Wolfebacteria bacterium]
MIESSAWPPYFGNVAGFYNSLEPFLAQGVKNIEWATAKNCVMVGGKDSGIEYYPTNKDAIEIVIKIDFPKIGKSECGFSLPKDQELLKTAFKAPTLGWPPHLYPISKFFRYFGWEHHNKIAWLQNHSSRELLEIIILHRLGDLAGAWSTLCHKRLVGGVIISNKAGHRLDLKLIKAVEI